MAPTLQSGQLIIALRTKRYARGDVVVAAVQGRAVVKRIRRIDQAGLWLEGDNAAHSTDSRHYGVVQPRDVVARVLFVR